MRIFAFLGERDVSSHYQAGVVFITVYPCDGTSEFSFDFADAGEADAFLEQLPQLVPPAMRGHFGG